MQLSYYQKSVDNYRITKGLFGWKKMVTLHSNITTHHSITHFLSLNNLQISPKPSLAPNSYLFFNFKNLKIWDPFLKLKKLKSQKLRLDLFQKHKKNQFGLSKVTARPEKCSDRGSLNVCVFTKMPS